MPQDKMHNCWMHSLTSIIGHNKSMFTGVKGLRFVIGPVFWMLICNGSCRFCFFIWIMMPLVQYIEIPERFSGLWSQLSNTKVTKVDGCTPVGM